MKPKYSFLIANYNNRQFAGEMLDSLIAQTFTGWEAIIVDDASADGGITDIVEARNDPRIKYIELDKNKGAAHAWNTGFQYACGEYFPIIGADDMLAPVYLEKIDEQVTQHPDISIVYVDLEFFGSVEKIESLPQKSVSELTKTQWIPHGGSCVTRKLMEKTGGYYEGDELKKGNIDWDFWISVAENGFFENIIHICEPLYRYRWHNSNMSIKRSPFEYITRKCIYKRHKEFFDKYGEGNQFLAAGYFQSAAALWNNDKKEEAIELASKGTMFKPLELPKLEENSISGAGRIIAFQEKNLAALGTEGIKATEENFLNRRELAFAYLSLNQWEAAEKHFYVLIGMAVDNMIKNLAAAFAIELSLLYSKHGQLQKAEEALDLALLCDPINLHALHLKFLKLGEEKKNNLAIQLFIPLLFVKNKYILEMAAPYFSLLKTLPNKNTGQIIQRLNEYANSGQNSKNNKDWQEQIYSISAGRKAYWEYRTLDLLKRYGNNNHDFDALRKAIKLANAKNILEIGCGNGRLLKMMSDMGLECTGQDISASALALTSKRKLHNVKLYCGTADSMDLQENSFDLVVCNRVLQHLSNDDLKKVINVIAHSGKFAYINECLPDQDMPESFYLRKYDIKKMLEANGMRLVCNIQISEIEMAMLFSKI